MLQSTVEPRTSSPRTWGCFSRAHRPRAACPVFPTHVGVFPMVWLEPASDASLPHARGGVSTKAAASAAVAASSPRTWGCFCVDFLRPGVQRVFPTHVGVFLVSSPALAFSSGLPHARGGVSAAKAAQKMGDGSSPRTWGCFRACAVAPQADGVFPTHVGVFLWRVAPWQPIAGLPHARGGVSLPA